MLMYSCWPAACGIFMRAGASASCKTRFVLALLDELVSGSHRVLVFSQSRLMLDILAGSLKHAYLRIDGSVSSAAERQVQPNASTTECSPGKQNPSLSVFTCTAACMCAIIKLCVGVCRCNF